MGRRKEKSNLKHRIFITPAAQKMLQGIKDLRIRKDIIKRIDALSQNAELQGKPLTGELSGYRSLRVVGQRYRILYRFTNQKVYIVAIGIRKEHSREDVYFLAQKLFRQGLLNLF